jgi:hypothetical protein
MMPTVVQLLEVFILILLMMAHAFEGNRHAVA